VENVDKLQGILVFCVLCIFADTSICYQQMHLLVIIRMDKLQGSLCLSFLVSFIGFTGVTTSRWLIFIKVSFDSFLNHCDLCSWIAL
jgi:hypothetical protein